MAQIVILALSDHVKGNKVTRVVAEGDFTYICLYDCEGTVDSGTFGWRYTRVQILIIWIAWISPNTSAYVIFNQAAGTYDSKHFFLSQ